MDTLLNKLLRLFRLGVSHFYSNIIFGIYLWFFPWCDIFITFCQAIATSGERVSLNLGFLNLPRYEAVFVISLQSHIWSMVLKLETIFEKVRACWGSICKLLALWWYALWLRYPETSAHPKEKDWQKPFFALCETAVWLHWGFPKFRFSVPTLLPVCMLWYLQNGWTEWDEIFTPWVKSPADSKYNVRTDVPHYQTRKPLNGCLFSQFYLILMLVFIL